MPQGQHGFGVIINPDEHVHALGFLTGKCYVPAADLDAGIMIHCQVQQIQRISVRSGINLGVPVETLEHQVFCQNLVADRFMDGPGRDFGRPAGIVSLNQVDAVLNDGAELLGSFNAFGQRLDAVLMREVDGVADKELLVSVVLDAGNQRPVDLDDLRRVAEYIDNITVAGAVVIDGNLCAAPGFA